MKAKAPPGAVNTSKSSTPLVLKKLVNWFLEAEDESAIAITFGYLFKLDY